MRFILIDRIVRIEKDTSAKGLKNLAMSEDYFEHHFLYFPIMPGVLMLEAMVELARWLMIFSTDFEYSGLLSSLKNAKFRSPAQPGDVLEVAVEWIERTKSGIFFQGRVFLEGKGIAEAHFENRLIQVKGNENRELLRRNFQFVTKRMKDFIEEQSG